MDAHAKQEESKSGNGTQRRSGVTIFDVADKAGVSFVSVSRVFNGHRNVSERMRNRVLEAARTLGYQPRLVARPGLIGILVSEEESVLAQSNHYHLCNHLFRAAARNGYFIEVIPVRMLDLLTQRLIDGVIEVDLGACCDVLLRKDFPNIPVVMTHACPFHPQNSLVTVDSELEIRQGLALFLEKGHQHIAILSENQGSLANDVRRNVVLELKNGCKDTQLRLDILPVEKRSPGELVNHILQNGYTGLLNFCSKLSLPILDVLLNERHVRIPQDLSILMLDNDELCSHYHPRISSLRQPTQSIADAAVKELLRLIRGEKASPPQIFSSIYVDHHTIRNLAI